MKKIVVKKGYTLEAVSWENDGDNYKTNFKTVDTIEEASKLYKICKELFCSKNNGNGGIGNSMEDESFQDVLDYINDNIELFPDLESMENIEKWNYFRDLSWELLGSSEWYDFRVCESCTITYSPNDIEVEVIVL